MPHGHGGHGGDGHGHSHGLTEPLLDVEHGHSHSETPKGNGHAHGHGGNEHGGHDQSGHSHGSHDHGGHDHGGHNHGGHDHGSHKGGCCDGHSHGGHEHGHGHGHRHGEKHKERGGVDDKRKMKRAIYCAFFFMCVEIVGGIVANSLAIVTDAAHMLSDVGGFIVSLLALQLAEMEATREFSFGFQQAEVLGALLSVMIVWALTAVLLSAAVNRFLNPEEIDAPVMFGIACVGFLVNIVLMRVLGHGHSHGGDDHGHSHGGSEEESGAAVQAALAHVIGDFVQSLGVCVAALCIWLKPFDVGVTENGISKWCYADPCCTVLFGFLVIFTTKSTTVRCVSTLMAKAPKHIDQEKLVDKLTDLPHVDSVHDLHVWSVGSSEVVCSAHIMIDGATHATEVLKGSIKVAKSMGIGHSTFQIEVVGEFDPSEEHYGTLHKNPSRRDIEGSSPGHLHGSPSPDSGHSHNSGHSHGGGHGHAGSGHGHAH